MVNEQLLVECFNYFKNNEGYHRTLVKIKEKYQSLGNWGGTIKLTNLSNLEQEALSGLLKKDCHHKSVTIKVNQFIKALEDTKFAGVDFGSMLNAYFDEKLISKKEALVQYEILKQQFFNQLIKQFERTYASEWLEHMVSTKCNAYRIISQYYEHDITELRLILIDVCKAFLRLSFDSSNLTRLAVLSSCTTKNPHSFDENQIRGKLLLYAIAFKINVEVPHQAEGVSELLYQSGIIKDEVSNYTVCSGLLAYDDLGLHKGWEGFYKRKESQHVSLLNLSTLLTVDSPCKKLFIFENPTVYTEVFNQTREIHAPIMCTFGNVKLASLIMMDKLMENGVTLYYSGDFDPEGLLIADKLKQRYQHQLVIWGYSTEQYKKHLSNKEISSKRLSILDNIQSKQLQDLVLKMKELQYATFQELLIDSYVADIKTYIK